MAQNSPHHVRSARNNPRNGGTSKTLSRGLIAGVALLVLVIILAAGLTPSGLAQPNSNKPDLFGQKADKMLQLVRKAHAHDIAQRPSDPSSRQGSRLEALSKTVGIHRNSGGGTNVDVVVTLTAGSDSELNAAGFSLGARVRDIATLQLDLEQLDQLASLSSVDKISAAVRRYPTNDRARQGSGVEDLSAQRLVAHTGQGLVVAVIDTGIDCRHADFTVPGSSGGPQTRIKALLDMTVYGSQGPDPGWNYVLPGQSAPIGNLYTEADINAALQIPKPANQSVDIVKQRDKNGHGTHKLARVSLPVRALI